MLTRRTLIASLSLIATPALAQTPAQPASPPMPVVATFSILADLVQNVGGARIALTTLVGPDDDAHVYQPTPSDGRALAAARVVFVNGLGFEGWIRRLVRSSGTRAEVVEAARGIDAIREATSGQGHSHGHSHGHGEFDPHAWHSITSVRRYVENIRDALIAADGDGAELYRTNAAAYLVRLQTLETEIRALLAAVPAERRRVLVQHGAFAYFQRDYGITFVSVQGVSTEAEPTAQQIASLIRQVRNRRITAIFAENITNPRSLQRIAAESSARMGGTLFSDALSPAGGPATTYIDLMRHNASTIARAISPQA
jgi:zinc/manganese transport system substrate-binding protein